MSLLALWGPDWAPSHALPCMLVLPVRCVADLAPKLVASAGWLRPPAMQDYPHTGVNGAFYLLLPACCRAFTTEPLYVYVYVIACYGVDTAQPE